MTIARANIAALVPQYRSQIEQDFATFAPMILADEFDERVQVMLYEPVTFNLPGTTYRPDFMAIMQSGRVVFCEVKSSKRAKGYDRTRIKIKAAAQLFPFFTFMEAVGRGQNWMLEVL